MTVVEAAPMPTPVLAAEAGLMVCVLDLADAATLPRPGPDDVLLLDLRGADPVLAARAIGWLSALATEAPCVVVGPPGDVALARLALRAGARAWLGRQASRAAVLDAVSAAALSRPPLGSAGRHALRMALAEAAGA